MVSPDILGASTGAGFGAATAILLGFNYLGITIMSFTFGICAVFLAYAVSKPAGLTLHCHWYLRALWSAPCSQPEHRL
jgi:ABC-type Fe3+-siderophore transport system permease subunit